MLKASVSRGVCGAECLAILLSNVLDKFIKSHPMGKIIWEGALIMKKTSILNPNKYNIEEVEWVDSAGPAEAGWFALDAEDFATPYDVHCFTSGYVIKDTKEELWLINSYHKNPHDIRCLGMISIPKVAIVKRTMVKKAV